MNIIYTLSEKNLKELHVLYQREWWTEGRTFQETVNCVNGSQLNIAIVNDNDKLMAYARVLTDFTFKALIFDVIVAESYRGCGLGDQLIELTKQHESLAKVKSFELYCLPEMCPFYERHGFSDDVAGVQLMRLTQK